MAAELISDELLDFTILCGMTGPWKWSLIFLATAHFFYIQMETHLKSNVWIQTKSVLVVLYSSWTSVSFLRIMKYGAFFWIPWRMLNNEASVRAFTYLSLTHSSVTGLLQAECLIISLFLAGYGTVVGYMKLEM